EAHNRDYADNRDISVLALNNDKDYKEGAERIGYVTKSDPDKTIFVDFASTRTIRKGQKELDTLQRVILTKRYSLILQVDKNCIFNRLPFHFSFFLFQVMYRKKFENHLTFTLRQGL